MKLFFKVFFILFFVFSIHGQDGFVFKNNHKKVGVDFKLVNNLVIIPLKINGIEMNFLLDTGVEETILFSLEDKKEIELKNAERIMLSGIGIDAAIPGLKSTGNTITFAGLKAEHQTIIVVLDENFNFSSNLGIPVNGIIGTHFFKNSLVEINYGAQKVFIHNKKNFRQVKLINYTKLKINFENNKPYIDGKVIINNQNYNTKLLIDTGNSDAIWLFENKIKIPDKNFDDYLGRGFGGEILGKRAKINKFKIDNFEFENPIVSFPDSIALKNLKLVENRAGSVGGEICRRFNLFFDYENKFLYLKKNQNFDKPFNYNKSGIEIQHSGLQMISKEDVDTALKISGIRIDFGDNALDLKYKFELKPNFEIAYIRKDSPAALSGLKSGDVILSINEDLIYKYSLQEINEMLKSDEDKNIKMEVKRNNNIYKFQFKLKNIL